MLADGADVGCRIDEEIRRLMRDVHVRILGPERRPVLPRGGFCRSTRRASALVLRLLEGSARRREGLEVLMHNTMTGTDGQRGPSPTAEDRAAAATRVGRFLKGEEGVLAIAHGRRPCRAAIIARHPGQMQPRDLADLASRCEASLYGVEYQPSQLARRLTGHWAFV